VRRRGVRALRRSTLLPVLLLGFLTLAPVALLAGGGIRTLWLLAATAYVASVIFGAVSAAFSSRSLRVGGLVAAGLVLTHVTYAAGFLRGLLLR
jgi:hypothetical protein